MEKETLKRLIENERKTLEDLYEKLDERVVKTEEEIKHYVCQLDEQPFTFGTSDFDVKFDVHRTEFTVSKSDGSSWPHKFEIITYKNYGEDKIKPSFDSGCIRASIDDTQAFKYLLIAAFVGKNFQKVSEFILSRIDVYYQYRKALNISEHSDTKQYLERQLNLLIEEEKNKEFDKIFYEGAVLEFTFNTENRSSSKLELGKTTVIKGRNRIRITKIKNKTFDFTVHDVNPEAGGWYTETYNEKIEKLRYGFKNWNNTSFTVVKDAEVYVKCPRCNCYRMHQKEALNATSRRDNKTYICPKCGENEALIDAGLEKDNYVDDCFKNKLANSKLTSTAEVK